MTAFGWSRVLILAVLLGAAGFGSAQAAKAPAGSYHDSCTGASASRDVLRARCEKAHRRHAWTKLEHVSTCVGDIANYDGQLICLRRREVPDGDWSDSCINPHLSQPGVFAAVCKSMRGGWIASEIALDKCRHGLSNAHGHLACKKEQPPAPPIPAAKPVDPATTGEPAEAQPPHGDQKLPPGSYQSSCRNLDFDGRYLSGECRDKRDVWQDTSLDTQSCKHDQEIGNSNGELVCRRGDDGREPPAGSYRKTCRALKFDGRFVRGECQDAKGAWVAALLDSRTCKDGDDIVNDDGEIVCRRPPPPPAPMPPPALIPPSAPAPTAPVLPATPAAPPANPPPPAVAPPAPASVPPPAPAPASPPPDKDGATSGAQTAAPSRDPETGGAPLPPGEPMSITLYEKKDFAGASRTFSGDAADLAPLGWNDLASSLQVRGVWEVCEEPNFGGHCARVIEDDADLADIKLNHKISSFRQMKAAQP